MKYRSPGGLWDAEDDCCEPRFANLLITFEHLHQSPIFLCIPPNDIMTRLTYNCAHLRLTKESLTVEFANENV